MRLVLLWAEGLRLKLSILGSQTCSVCIHPPNHSVLPLLDHCQFHRCRCFREIFLKCPEGIITILLEPFLHSTPEEFNEVQFTVEFEQENTQMSCSFDDFLNQWSFHHQPLNQSMHSHYLKTGNDWQFHPNRITCLNLEKYMPVCHSECPRSPAHWIPNIILVEGAFLVEHVPQLLSCTFS